MELKVCVSTIESYKNNTPGLWLTLPQDSNYLKKQLSNTFPGAVPSDYLTQNFTGDLLFTYSDNIFDINHLAQYLNDLPHNDVMSIIGYCKGMDVRSCNKIFNVSLQVQKIKSFTLSTDKCSDLEAQLGKAIVETHAELKSSIQKASKLLSADYFDYKALGAKTDADLGGYFYPGKYIDCYNSNIYLNAYSKDDIKTRLASSPKKRVSR